MPPATIEFPERALFAHEIPVRITDLNYGRHLGHDTLVSLLHEARARFFQHAGMAEDDVDGLGIILTELWVSYRAQVFFGQTLKVEIARGDLGTRGCELLYRVSDRENGTPVALARTGLLFFDYGRGRVAAMPERFRCLIAAEDGVE
jgi:acyl-CoA thioesterase FadM